MVCVHRLRVSAFVLILTVITNIVPSSAKDGVSPNTESKSSTRKVDDKFQWNEHKKLSWDDFKGAVKSVSEQSAAATHCGIGFTVQKNTKPEVIVYNTFYVNKSWVKADAKIPSILTHEQGHFDLCEIYTRILRSRLSNFDFNVPDMMNGLMNIYNEVNAEYEARQQSYEKETAHGTDIPQQSKWCGIIDRELAENAHLLTQK